MADFNFFTLLSESDFMTQPQQATDKIDAHTTFVLTWKETTGILCRRRHLRRPSAMRLSPVGALYHFVRSIPKTRTAGWTCSAVKPTFKALVLLCPHTKALLCSHFHGAPKIGLLQPMRAVSAWHVQGWLYERFCHPDR